MSEQTIAFPYAKAFIEQSLLENWLEKANSDMELISRVGIENPALGQALKNPLIHLEKKRSLIVSVFSKSIESKTMKFLDILVQKERAGVLMAVAEEFSRQYREYHHIQAVEVITAFPLGPKLESEVLSHLEKELQQKVFLTKSVDSDLIGGILIKIGDRQYNGTIRKGLTEIRKSLMEKSFINSITT